MYFILHPIASINHLAARLLTDQISFLIAIIFFVFLSLNYKNRFWQSIDESVSEWAINTKSSFIKSRAEDFAMFGNALFHILYSIILSVIFFTARHRFSIVIAILFALIFSWGFNRFLKLIYKRTRPGHLDAGIRRRMSFCFPSGHVMASIPIYFFSAVLLQGLIPILPWYIIAFVITSFVIMSRIYLNHHYFTDVLGGIAMGIFCLHISIWFYFVTGML